MSYLILVALKLAKTKEFQVNLVCTCFCRSNRRYFDAFQISPLVQEMLRTCDPLNAFLALNLRSIIFNLGQGKT